MGKDKSSMFAVSPLYESRQVFTIVMTLVTIILAAIAYAELKEISGDVIDVINNWKLVPFVEVYVAEEGVECSSEFEEVSYKYGRFEGLSRGHCGCVVNPMNEFVSTYTNCSDEATASGYCMTSNSRGTVDASTWRHQRVCFKRSGQAAATWGDGYVRRPYVDSDGNCPSEYKKCGDGIDYENDKAICYPEGDTCPITSITVEPQGSTPTGDGWEMSNGTFSQDDYNLWFRREVLGELPLAQLALTLTEYSSSDVGPDYNHAENNRGPCYTGGAQDIKSAMTVSDSTLAAHSVSKPRKCKRIDRRYRLFDKLRLDSFYLDQLEELSYCTEYNITTTDDSSFDASTDADYLLSDIPCVGEACDRATSFPTSCSSSDNTCDLVVNQNICGQYVSAVRDLRTDTNSMGTYYRNEISWKEDCAVDQDRLRDNVDPLKAALDAQLAVVVISSIFGVLVGIMWPIYMLSAGKKKFYGKPNEITIPERVDSIVHMVKLGPLIASVSILSDIYKLYESAGADKCSDDLTNESFEYLAENLPKIFYTNIGNICVEVLMMIAGIYFLYSKMKKQMQVNVETTVEGGATDDKEVTSGAAVPVQQVQGGVQMQQPIQPQAQQQWQPQPNQPQQMQVPQQPVQFVQVPQQPVLYQQVPQQQQQVPFQQQPVQFQQQQPQFQQQQPQFQQQQPQYQPQQAQQPMVMATVINTSS